MPERVGVGVSRLITCKLGGGVVGWGRTVCAAGEAEATAVEAETGAEVATGEAAGVAATFSGTTATVEAVTWDWAGVEPGEGVAAAFAAGVEEGIVVGPGVWAGAVTFVPETGIEGRGVTVGVEVGATVRVGVGIGAKVGKGVGKGVGVGGAKIVTLTVGLLVTTRLAGSSTWTGMV